MPATPRSRFCERGTPRAPTYEVSRWIASRAPALGTMGSQGTTGPMQRDELKDLAYLGLSADLTMQGFCHTACCVVVVEVFGLPGVSLAVSWYSARPIGPMVFVCRYRPA